MAQEIKLKVGIDQKELLDFKKVLQDGVKISFKNIGESIRKSLLPIQAMTDQLAKNFTTPIIVQAKKDIADLSKTLMTFPYLPLSTFFKYGSGIITEIGKGIISKTKTGLRTALTGIGLFIKRFFPHSPADEGPLVGLRVWGGRILDELSFGMYSRLSSFLDSVTSIAKRLAESLRPVLEAGAVSERIGIGVDKISQIQYALTGYEVTVSDLQLAFNSLKNTIASVNDESKLASLSAIGIDLDRARQAAEPTLELYYQLLDATQKFPISSVRMKSAFEALGLTLQSNFVNSLQMSREQVQKMQEEGNTLGATISDSFFKLGFTFNETWQKINKLGAFLEREFSAMILPAMTSLNQFFLEIYTQNVVKLRALVRVAGQVLEAILTMVKDFMATAISNPAQAGDVVIKLIMAVWDSIKRIGSVIWDDLSDGIMLYSLTFLQSIGKFIAFATWEYLKAAGSLFGTSITYGLEWLQSKLFAWIKDLANSSWLSRFLSQDLIDTINKAAAEVDKTVNNTGDTILRTIDDAQSAVQDLAQDARRGVAESAIGLIDPEAAQRTADRFKMAFADIRTQFRAAYAGTEFERDIELGIAKIQTAVTAANFDKVITDVKNGIQTTRIELDELGNVLQTVEIKADAGLQTLRGTINNIGHEADKTKDKLLNVLSAQESIARELKLQQVDLDMRVRTALDGYAQQKANDDKALLDLKIKHNDELKSYTDLLATKYKMGRDEVRQSAEFTKMRLLQQQEYTQSAAKLERTRLTTQAQTISDAFGNFSQAMNTVYDETGKKHKAFFYLSKSLALSQAIINTALAVVNAFSQGGPFLGPVLAGMAGAAGAVQIGVIMAQTFRGFNKGGFVGGRDEGNKDTVPAKLTVGEYVMPRDVTKSYGLGAMEALRKKRIPKTLLDTYSVPQMPKPHVGNFNAGGIVLGTDSTRQPQKAQTTITTINVVDPSLLDAYMATTEAKNAILNIISHNAPLVKRTLSV